MIMSPKYYSEQVPQLSLRRSWSVIYSPDGNNVYGSKGESLRG